MERSLQRNSEQETKKKIRKLKFNGKEPTKEFRTRQFSKVLEDIKERQERSEKTIRCRKKKETGDFYRPSKCIKWKLWYTRNAL
jgi:hypothetical protein